ncbi:hypothetical protein HPB51_008285 [Rhipicephalus microplus]|uniref:40S ribosomal protein S15 n=1 Tax=Rhipicephalus microplus TaxID=6941 RepID=A0A9J6EZV3_RHIMP|nr:hypothetical protein HPB51_008285 [Rhipicephalus microplus]
MGGCEEPEIAVMFRPEARRQCVAWFPRSALSCLDILLRTLHVFMAFLDDCSPYGKSQARLVYPTARRSQMSLPERPLKVSRSANSESALVNATPGPIESTQLMELMHCRARRRYSRGLKRKPLALIKKLRRAKKECGPLEKPEVVKTHLRDMLVVPEMVGSIVGVYNGKAFNQVEIKPEMIGHYLGEFSITYKPVKHGRPGIGATHSSRFIPLK